MPMSITRSQRGFTLLEMIVSIGIFSIVMLVTMSAYFNLISLDRRARATNQVVNNLSFAVDAMVRGIRTGKGYQCLDGSPDGNGNSTSGNCTKFSYTDSTLAAGSQVVTYFQKTNGTIGRCESSAPCILDASASSITDPAITITKLVFYVRGAGNSNDDQPQVLFTISGTMPADSKGNKATFVIEESATQRLIDL
jgi:prepilin-type N-terminal cleavage/methylation domain-containing protein